MRHLVTLAGLLLLAVALQLGAASEQGHSPNVASSLLGAHGDAESDHGRHGHHVHSKERKYPLTLDAPVGLRCSVTKGGWCQDALAQEPVAWKPAPRGSTECDPPCSRAGRCNHDTGLCECMAGWTGRDCTTPQKRPCTNRLRTPEDPSTEPASFIGPDKRDLNWTSPVGISWPPYSRCAGVCDDDLAICYCDGPMGRIPAPEGSPPGTPPIRRGRPLITFHMAPTTTWDGKKAFGEFPYEQVYGPKGYCNVTQPVWTAGCTLDDLGGLTCDEPVQAFCPGACSGHGFCNLGFCVCDDGYYGHDCSRRKAGLPLLNSRIPTTPWLASVVREPPAALEPPPRATRRRPLVYVYDLEPLFQARLLQYRVGTTTCLHRRHTDQGNATVWTDEWVYAADTLLHESLLISEYRTFDPEEADYFYVPHYGSCIPYPIWNWADWPYFGGPGPPRVRHIANMLMDTVEWVNATHPFWQRRGGRDHVFLFTHDEGACWAPNVLNNSIWLTHWGRMGLDHKSQTGYGWDNYDWETISPHQPEGWLKFIKGHPCYNPDKDLVIPAFKQPRHYSESALLGKPARERDVLFFFKGDVGKHRAPQYSRGVRQKIYNMSKEGGWAKAHKFLIGGHDDEEVKGSYSELLARSVFCLVAGGDGWSARMEDAVLHGCIPVTIMDGVHAVFESVLDLDSFSVRIAEADVGRILEILQAVPERSVRAKQAHLGHVWHRFRYASLPGLASELQKRRDNNTAIVNKAPPQAGPDGGAVHFPRPFKGDDTVDDAFETIMQWLYSRIPHTRG